MALQNERDEGKQAPWFARLARERQDLSASVEDALHAEKEQSWQEDEGQEEAGTADKALIPPRLSLQSRPMPAVEIEEKLTTRKLPVPETYKLPAIHRQQEKETGGFLARFARRLTSSLAAFGQGTDSFPALPPPSSDEGQRLSRQRDEVSLLPPDVVEKAESGQAQPAKTSETVPATPAPSRPRPVPPRPVMAPVTAVLPTMPGTLARPGRYRQRLAGRTTRVRLQTAPVPAVPRPVTPRVSALEAAARAQSIEEARREEQASMSNMPTVMIAQDEPGASISVAGPLEIKEKGTAHSVLHAITGNGVCEAGQHDVMVHNQAVTAASLVLITLTSNPGPVVVQYVSLQAGTGFTIHLTASAEARTTFNYAILTDKLT